MVLTHIRQGSFDTNFIDIHGYFDDSNNEDADGDDDNEDERGHDNYGSDHTHITIRTSVTIILRMVMTELV